jgi:hypothetical protein
MGTEMVSSGSPSRRDRMYDDAVYEGGSVVECCGGAELITLAVISMCGIFIVNTRTPSRDLYSQKPASCRRSYR